MDHDRIDARVRAGATEVWDVINDSMQPHNWHVHGARLRVVETDEGVLPADHHVGWKDTVYVAPGQRLRIVIEVVDHIDERGATFPRALTVSLAGALFGVVAGSILGALVDVVTGAGAGVLVGGAVAAPAGATLAAVRVGADG